MAGDPQLSSAATSRFGTMSARGLASRKGLARARAPHIGDALPGRGAAIGAASWCLCLRASDIRSLPDRRAESARARCEPIAVQRYRAARHLALDARRCSKRESLKCAKRDSATHSPALFPGSPWPKQQIERAGKGPRQFRDGSRDRGRERSRLARPAKSAPARELKVALALMRFHLLLDVNRGLR